MTSFACKWPISLHLCKLNGGRSYQQPIRPSPRQTGGEIQQLTCSRQAGRNSLQEHFIQISHLLFSPSCLISPSHMPSPFIQFPKTPTACIHNNNNFNNNNMVMMMVFLLLIYFCTALALAHTFCTPARTATPTCPFFSLHLFYILLLFASIFSSPSSSIYLSLYNQSFFQVSLISMCHFLHTAPHALPA